MEWSTFKQEFELDANKVEQWLLSEFDKIRSGRVNINIFNGIKVEAYGDLMPLNQLSNIQVVDATQVLIKPYDRNQINAIAKAILASDLNVNPQTNVDNIRIVFPAQTEENRKSNVKRTKEFLEIAKNKIRDVRKNIQSKIKKLDGISEDTITYFEQELDKITKSYNNKFDGLFQNKEHELMKL